MSLEKDSSNLVATRLLARRETEVSEPVLSRDRQRRLSVYFPMLIYG